MDIEEQLAMDAEHLGFQILPQALADFATANREPVLGKVMKLYKKMDDISSESKAPIDCIEGCSYCCHYRVMVSPTEVFAIAEYISRLPSTQQAKLAARVAETSRTVAHFTPEEHKFTNVPCALLDNDICSVYEARPIACRRHHSTNVTACKATFVDVHSKKQIGQDYLRKMVATAIENVQLAIHYRMHLDTNMYELHGALNVALEGHGALKRWRSGKAAFPNVPHKVTLAERTKTQ